MRALVFGATGDLGRAIADRLAADGMELILHGHRNSDALALLSALYPGAMTSSADVRVPQEVENLVAQAGSFDVLVYAVGVNPTTETVDQLDLDTWNDVLAVNLTGAFLALKYSLPVLRHSDVASVVLVSSIFGRQTPDRRLAYGASKHGLTGLVQGVAREEGPRVRINAVAPGPMWSENVRSIFYKQALAENISLDDYVLRRVADIPMGRFAQLEECASVVSFLCSANSSFISGEIIPVAGGAIR
jgi:3-hydroxybutyrate dehydrogenase